MTCDKKFEALIVVAFCLSTPALAGDAVAIGFNADGVWTNVTYYASSKPKGSKDYKTENEARDAAIRDLRKRDMVQAARVEILSSSDSTGFVAVARGTIAGKGDVILVRRGKTQAEADAKAFEQLKASGAIKDQRIVYRYHSYGADGK